MANARQFMVPLNYDITKLVYPDNVIVRTHQYHMNEVVSPKEYHELYIKPFDEKTKSSSKFYTDKLRRRVGFI